MLLLLASAATAAAPPPAAPHWAVQGAPAAGQPLCGFPLAAGLSTTTVLRATAELGAYNHGAMMDYHFGNLFLAWKNSPRDEDSPGQRILFAQSATGVTWTKTDGRNGARLTLPPCCRSALTLPPCGAELFPNMSTTANPAALSNVEHQARHFVGVVATNILGIGTGIRQGWGGGGGG